MDMATKMDIEHETEFTVVCSPEQEAIGRNSRAFGDPVARADEDALRRRIEDGDDWAWCNIVVRAEWRGLTGEDSLGCCSYKSLADFERRRTYGDMRENAFADLVEKIGRVQLKAGKELS